MKLHVLNLTFFLTNTIYYFIDYTGLLNLRGSDLPLAPTFFSFAFILRDHLHLFVDADRLSVEIQNELEIQTERNITYHNYSDVDYQLELTVGKTSIVKNLCNWFRF